MPTIFERIKDKLALAAIPFAVSEHEPVFTSEQAAAVRGAALASGAKALVVKAGDRFVLLVMPADRKLDSKKARANLGVKSIRFATKEELLDMTGLAPGAVPPFGSLFELPTYVDPALAANASINFNAGDHAVSIQMTFADYLRAEGPLSVELT
jgi:Ala-tRNA(Pro) deacylase